jgi:lactate permease
MGSVQYLVAVAGLWNIAAFVGSMAGGLVAIPLAHRLPGEKREAGTLDGRALVIALSGYVVLVAVILAVQLIPALSEFLSKVIIQVQFPEMRTALGFLTPAGTGRKIVVFRHTGTVLIYAAILAYLIYRRAGLYQPGAVRRILDGTVRRVMSSSVSILSMVAIAVIMDHAGMTDHLARDLAEGVGRFFPLISPWIGALGAFMTGSNTNSNVVFGALQMKTAGLLDYRIPVILAAQTAGAALGSVMAPTKVVVGASTAGMAGQEGEVMARLLIYVSTLLLLISALTFLLAD